MEQRNEREEAAHRIGGEIMEELLAEIQRYNGETESSYPSLTLPPIPPSPPPSAKEGTTAWQPQSVEQTGSPATLSPGRVHIHPPPPPPTAKEGTTTWQPQFVEQTGSTAPPTAQEGTTDWHP